MNSASGPALQSAFQVPANIHCAGIEITRFPSGVVFTAPDF